MNTTIMKINHRILTLLVIATFLFTSCNNMKQDGAVIPKTALSVMHLNIESLSNEAEWSEIKNAGWFQNTINDSNVPYWLKSMAQNPETSGIDFKKGLTFFVNADSSQQTYIGVTGSIDNENKFEKFTTAMQGAAPPTETKGIKMVMNQNELAGWHNKRFLYLTTQNVEGLNPSDLQANIQKINLADECVHLFNLEKSNSVDRIESFKSLSKQSGDIQVWINGQEINKYGPAMSAMSMFKSEVFFKNNFSTFNISFEKGEVNVDQKQYASKEFINYLKNNIGASIDEHMVENLPAGDILAVMSLSLKPAAIEELIKLIGADGLVNMFLQQAGFTLVDLTKANNGNILFAMTQPNVMSTDSLSPLKKTTMLLAIGVNDQMAAQKITTAAKKMIPGAEGNLPQAADELDVQNNNRYIVLSNSSAYANKYLNGDGKQENILKSLEENAIAGIIDLRKVFTIAGTDSSAWKNELLDVNKTMWNSVQIKGGKVDKDALNINVKVKLNDNSKNSLVQLNDYFNQVYDIYERKRETIPKKNLDSLLTPPKFDTVAITGAKPGPGNGNQ